MKANSAGLIVFVTAWSTVLFVVGCGPSATPGAGMAPISLSNTCPTPSNRSPGPASPFLTFVVPEQVENIVKRKCHVCHGGAKTEGGFDLKKMIYRTEPESDWRPMDLAGVTRIKLAVLPLNGKPARMPKKAGSIWNPLTVEEANAVAKWTDFPYER